MPYDPLPLEYDPDSYLKRKSTDYGLGSIDSIPTTTPVSPSITQSSSAIPKSGGFVNWWNKLDPYRRNALSTGMLSAGLKMMEAGGRTYATPVSATSIIGTGGLEGVRQYEDTLARERNYGLRTDSLDLYKRQIDMATAEHAAKYPYITPALEQQQELRGLQIERAKRPIYHSPTIVPPGSLGYVDDKGYHPFTQQNEDQFKQDWYKFERFLKVHTPVKQLSILPPKDLPETKGLMDTVEDALLKSTNKDKDQVLDSFYRWKRKILNYYAPPIQNRTSPESLPEGEGLKLQESSKFTRDEIMDYITDENIRYTAEEYNRDEDALRELIKEAGY